MNNQGRRRIASFRIALLGLIYGLFTSAPAVADDIEIYTGSLSASSAFAAYANVLFIVDTSGSMDATVLARDDYDPSLNYGDVDGCFDPNTMYFDINLGGSEGVSERPPCSALFRSRRLRLPLADRYANRLPL